MNLHDTLTTVVPEINTHLEAINCGGCGWFAHSLHTLLAEKGIASDIVLVKWSYYNASDVKFMIRKMQADNINDAYRKLWGGGEYSYVNPCLGHIGVRVNGVIYDCNGVLTKPAISDAIDADVLNLALDGSNLGSASRWNPTFMDANYGLEESAVCTMRNFLTQALVGVTHA